MSLSISSNAFKDGERIPTKYTCEGLNVSPPLQWTEPPAGTVSFALIVDDPDAPAGTFTHWVLFNIPIGVRRLDESIPRQDRLQIGALHGKTDYGTVGYGGPCPPRGPVHHYRFTIYALDKAIDLKAGASKKQLLDAIKGRILAQAQLTGLYQR
ncbi:MAG: YbhB/YbcL family Raf kinase inhibitor-like protein [Dehalococcoidales bacterium]|nr:YbhB/YbcL family Raf kinase inhibitor-like protein [Dehalococcoidales bacterium]